MSYQGIAAYTQPQANGLEHITYNANVGTRSYAEEAIHQTQPMPFYTHQETRSQYVQSESRLYNAVSTNPVTIEYAFTPDTFLKPNRLPQPFVGDAADIEEPIKEAFQKTINLPFPTDIKITVLKESEFRTHASSPGVVGFSINRKQHGLISDIFILADEKDRVLLTAGHEIGHVLSTSINNKQMEEAKAFAFTRAWMQTIKEHNIANMKNAITSENPAHNGIHDVGFAFVQKQLQSGKDALQLYWELVRGGLEHVIGV